MANADILSALDRLGKYGSLENLKIYGRVRCAIAKPRMIGKLEVSSGCTLAILDAFAIKCLNTDYFSSNGERGTNGVYYTKGSMIICIDRKEYIGKDVIIGGTTWANGVKVKRQLGHTGRYDGITALAFRKEGSLFVVVPNIIKELTDKIDPHLKNTPLEDFIIKLNHEEPIPYPTSLNSLEPYEGVEDYEEISDLFEGKSFIDDGKKVDVSKIKLNLVHNLEGKSVSEYLGDVEEDAMEQAKNRKRYAENILADITEKYENTSKTMGEIALEIRKAFVDKVASRYTEYIGNSKEKGKVYVDQLLAEFINPIVDLDDKEELKESSGLKAAIEVLMSRVQADPGCLMLGYVPDVPNKGNVEVMSLKENKSFALAVVGVVTGMGLSKIKSNYWVASRRWGMSFDMYFFTLLHYPYVLGMLGSKLSVVELDRLYFSISKKFSLGLFSKENGEVRNCLIFLNTLEEADPKSTLVDVDALKKKPGSYPAQGKNTMLNNHFPASQGIVELLKVLCGDNIVLSNKVVNFLLNSKWYTEERREYLQNNGIINSVDDMVILEKDLEKELMIYKTLIEKGKEPTGITIEQVEEAIEYAEENNGFKLEALQKDGIQLCMHKAGVLSGCAGSGKTTTSDCMSYCLEKNMPEGYKMIYCTPTGKASRRLAEVVHGTVKTIHSQFRVGLYGEDRLSSVKSSAEFSSRNIYLLDEMAMCNTSLLYEVVRNLGKQDLIYFLGDIKQLVSIGKGNPFNLLMKFLPCVELGVSKRAAEGSEVNYNTTLINHLSGSETRELYYDDKTFMCRECADASIYLEAGKAWKGFMNGSMNGTTYKEEEIQIITGYAKPTVLFSTSNINVVIQRILRKNDKFLFKNGTRDFYKNDRVIHINSNLYGVQRYVEVDTNTFRPVVTLGVVNGEMGKLEGIVCTTAVTIEDVESFDINNPEYENIDEETLKSLTEIREERESSIRDDLLVKGEKFYLVKVRVFDVDLQKDVFIFYPANAHQQDEYLSLTGYDLNNLDLAYALTTHKMQGSQSRVCILLFGSTCSPSFINRNMINTMVTRSQEVVCMVGTIKGENSPVTKGRQAPSNMETKDILSLLVNDKI